MSVETLATVISSAGLLLALAGGFGWLILRSDAQVRHLSDKIDEETRRLDAKIEAKGDRLDAKIEAQGDRLDAKIDEQTRRLDAKIDSWGREIVEVKVAIARLEGPLPHLVPAR